MKNGFTLVELLVMVGILGIVGVILGQTLTQIYRGQNKVNIISKVKQNSQVALDQIEKVIKAADNVVCIDTVSNQKLVVNAQGRYIRILFFPPVVGTTNGYIAFDYPDSNLQAQACSAPASAALTNLVAITNTDPTSGVSISQGQFTWFSSPGYKDSVKIDFVGNVGERSAATAENLIGTSGVPMSLTVEVR